MSEIEREEFVTRMKALTEEEIDLFLETVPVYKLLSKANEKYAILEYKLQEITKLTN